jgi:hypothetical protein
MRYLCDARLFDIGSFTDAGVTYRVSIPTDPAVPATCSCPQGTYVPWKDCKHIREVRYGLEDDSFPELLEPGDDVSDVADLFETALTWVNGDVKRAAGLVKAYIAGRDQA